MPFMKRLRSGIGAQHLDHLAIEQAEISRMFGDLIIAHAVVSAIEEVRRNPLGRAVLFAVRADAVDDFKPFPPFLDHGAEHFRGILHIDVDRNHRFAADMVEPGRKRRLLAEIA